MISGQMLFSQPLETRGSHPGRQQMLAIFPVGFPIDFLRKPAGKIVNGRSHDRGMHAIVNANGLPSFQIAII